MRTDLGYTILSENDRPELRVGEYMMLDASRRTRSGRRIQISNAAWEKVLERANHSCEWKEDGLRCGLKQGEIDPTGGGTVNLTADHMAPHAAGSQVHGNDWKVWQALCGRHQVMKKNYWDNTTGKINYIAVLQQASIKNKRAAYEFLKTYFKTK